MLHCNASNTGCAYCTKNLLKIQGLRDRAREREVTISFKRVLPSLVSLISPAPPTSLQQNQRESERERERERERDVYIYILMVPLGPRLDLRTSCKPLAALMFMWSAADLFSTSAFGFSPISDIIFLFMLPSFFSLSLSVYLGFSISKREFQKRRRWESENFFDLYFVLLLKERSLQNYTLTNTINLFGSVALFARLQN